MQRFTKPYVYLAALISFMLVSYFVFTEPIGFNIQIALCMLATIWLQYDESIVGRDIAVSLTDGSCIFMAICFGVYPPIIACSVGMILTAMIKYRNSFRVSDLKEMGLQKAVKHEDVFIKTLFNISKIVIKVSLVYFLYGALNIDFSGQAGMWKVGLISLIDDAVEMTMITLAESFNYGEWNLRVVLNERMGVLALNSFVISIMMTYSYKRIGFAGVMLLYMILFPMQNTMFMYTKAKNQERELFIDELTGIYNIRFFKDLLGNKIARKNSFSLLMLDIDNFKSINDTYGHQAGNKILKDFTKLIKQRMTGDNYMCRYGGDEFFIVTNTPREAESLAEQIIGDMGEHSFEYEQQMIRIQMSIGIYDHGADDPDDISSVVKKADSAMYCAKKNGNNKIIEYKQMVQTV